MLVDLCFPINFVFSLYHEIYLYYSESYIYCIYELFSWIFLLLLFLWKLFLETHRFPDLYEKTPPMSPRRVARDVIETLDTDGNGKKFLFSLRSNILLYYISFYLKLVLTSIEKL